MCVVVVNQNQNQNQNLFHLQVVSKEPENTNAVREITDVVRKPIIVINIALLDIERTPSQKVVEQQ